MAKKFVIDDYQFGKIVPKLAEDFGVEGVDDCDLHSFDFDNQLGKGSILGINYENGVSIKTIDLTANNDMIFSYELGRRHPILFLYVKEGKIDLDNTKSSTTISVENGESTLYAPQGDSNYSYTVKANQSTRIVIVSVIRFLFYRKIECDLDTLPDSLQELFKDTTGAKQFDFESSVNQTTLTVLSEIFQSELSGMERKMILEAKALELVTNMIKRYRVEKSSKISGYKYSNYDIKSLNEAKNIIIDSIAKVPTVKELSLQVGMNVNKLQKGFQLIFGKSIRQFVISFRMHRALNLLESGNHSITEIAHNLGYTNKGHFSQLFRKEFGLLPSEYNSKSNTYVSLEQDSNSKV